MHRLLLIWRTLDNLRDTALLRCPVGGGEGTPVVSILCFNSIFPLKVHYGRGTVLSPVRVLTTQILNIDSGFKPAYPAVSVCTQVTHTGVFVCSEDLGNQTQGPGRLPGR